MSAAIPRPTAVSAPRPLLPGLSRALLALAACSLAGAWLAPWVATVLPQPAIWLPLPVLLALGLSGRPLLAEGALLAVLLLLPAWRWQQRQRPPGEEERAQLAEALLWQEERRAGLADGRLRLEGRAWQREGGHWRALPGRLAVWVEPRLGAAPGRPRLLAGAAPFWTARPPGANPGEARPRELDWRAGRLGGLDAGRFALAEVLGAPPLELGRLERLRERLLDRLHAETGRAAPLLFALLLGEREALSPDLSGAFRDCGLSHLLAVSGLHVALLAGALALLLASAPLPRSLKPLLLVALLALYAPLTGARPSVVRAATMGGWLVGARLLGRPSGAGAALALSAVAELAWRPEELRGAGFLLSYGAVAALLLAMEPARRLDRRLGRAPRWLRAPVRWVAASLAASLAATQGTAAPLLAFFGRLPLVSPLLNLPALPLAAMLLAAGWLQLLLPLPGAPFGRAAEGLAAALEGLALTAARHGPWTLVWRPAPLQGVLLGALLLLLSLPRGRLRLRLALVALGLLILVDLGPRLHRPRSGELLMIDVGQGDALLLRSPSGARWLVDAGWADPRGQGRDAGRDRILPLLERLAPRGLQGLVLSHPDQDHIGGATALLAGISVDTVWWNGEWRDNPPQLALRALLAAPGAPPLALPVPGRILLDEAGLRLSALGPPPEGRCPPGNERSIVLRVETPTASALLPADAGHPAEEWLAAWGQWLRADLLKLGHHGSSHSSSEAFLDLVAPGLAWVSVGGNNRYGHPASGVLERCQRRGIAVHRSDLHGAAWVRAGPGGWEAVSGLPWCRPVGLRGGPLLSAREPPPQVAAAE
jgi:competence protein ComEC